MCGDLVPDYFQVGRRTPVRATVGAIDPPKFASLPFYDSFDRWRVTDYDTSNAKILQNQVDLLIDRQCGRRAGWDRRHRRVIAVAPTDQAPIPKWSLRTIDD